MYTPCKRIKIFLFTAGGCNVGYSEAVAFYELFIQQNLVVVDYSFQNDTLSGNIVLFVPRSLLARGWMKKVFSPVLSESLYRQVYFLVSSVTLFLAAYGWSPLPHGVWHVQSPGLRLSFYCKL